MKPRKVLVVDDSKLMHRMYQAMLEVDELLHANDGREALNLLTEHPDTDLVLLDVNMPVMNGLQFLEERRYDPRGATVPVVIVSTEGAEEDTIRGLKAGALAYVRKPFEKEALLELIERLPTPT